MQASRIKERPPLNTCAQALFKAFINNPKLQVLIARCIYNGHTWDCESLSNQCHMYQAKRIVFKRWQLIPMYCGKLAKNENKWTRRTIAWFERARQSGQRRLAQKDTPRLCPLYSPSTDYWRSMTAAGRHSWPKPLCD